MNKPRSRYLRSRRIFLVLFIFSALPALMFGALAALTLEPSGASDSTAGPSRVTLAGAGVFCLVSLATLIGFLVATVRLSRWKGKRDRRAQLERLAEWRSVLDTRLGMSDLRTLCFDLGIDYDNLPGATKSDKAEALLLYVYRGQRLADLAEVGARLRPDIPWDTLARGGER